MVLRRDIYDRDMINSWENGRRVTLLGDAAAYPMQPNLGQGGCMAIEDSYQLILELKKVDMRNSDEESQLKQISESLNRYQSKRMFRVKTVHKVSRLASETLYTYKLSLDFGLSKLSNIFGVQITNYAIDITRKLMQWCCQLFMIWMIAGYGMLTGRHTRVSTKTLHDTKNNSLLQPMWGLSSATTMWFIISHILQPNNFQCWKILICRIYVGRLKELN